MNQSLEFLIDIDGDRLPDTLERWAWQTILASFVEDEIAEVWGDAQQYLGWLNSLPLHVEVIVWDVSPFTPGG